jgi:hypothetical protein
LGHDLWVGFARRDGRTGVARSGGVAGGEAGGCDCLARQGPAPRFIRPLGARKRARAGRAGVARGAVDDAGI